MSSNWFAKHNTLLSKPALELLRHDNFFNTVNLVIFHDLLICNEVFRLLETKRNHIHQTNTNRRKFRTNFYVQVFDRGILAKNLQVSYYTNDRLSCKYFILWMITIDFSDFKDEPYVGIFLADKPCLVVRDFDLICRILKQDFHHFNNRIVSFSKITDPIGSRRYALIFI